MQIIINSLIYLTFFYMFNYIYIYIILLNVIIMIKLYYNFVYYKINN